MKQLINVKKSESGESVVSARELYVKLGYTDRQFSRWAKKHIVANPYAIEGRDWVGFDTYVEGNYVTDYVLTVDFSKKLCMISKTVVGEKIRNYFLEVERIAQKATAPQISEAKLRELEDKINRLDAHTITSEVKEFSIAGYARLCNKRIYGHEAMKLGKSAAKMCKELDLPVGTIYDTRFGKVNIYPEEVLKQVFEDFFKLPRF